ncbi:MAG: ectonucleotide pyrophosphatase/phosphodiesterase [Leptospiraceae bacterium]|nr:ectonucleotide pyrophosphatase/phosphodiesterase [Leptospiraceae bacterium]
MQKKWIFLAAIALPAMLLSAKTRPRLLIWSIDGFAAGYLDHPRFKTHPRWQRLLKQARVFSPVETTIPSVTYPAHTAMVTGVHPARHRIHSNHPVDPFNLAKNGWNWYASDIAVPTLWQIAKKQGKTVANLQWPVTMLPAGEIRWHVPQFERARGPEEVKLMRVLSTPGLHEEIEKATGVALTETSTDSERFQAALYVWQKKKPDLMLLYFPQLDATEHAAGPYSEAAFAVLDALSTKIADFAQKILQEKNSAMLIVSDHGFLSFQGRCYPNTLLVELGMLDPERKVWSYYFDTAGGVARLVRNGGVVPDFPAKAFANRIQQECAGVEFIAPENPEFQKFSHYYARGAAGFLVSRGKVALSPAWGVQIFDAEATGHTHGFLPSRAEMKTLALLFTRSQRPVKPIRHNTEIFQFACSWLKLRCRNK